MPNAIRATIGRFKSDSGQTIIEYGLVLGALSIVLIALFVVAGLTDAFQALVDAVGDFLV